MIDPVLARRIDRFGRRAHAFHRFAHHPLCPAYAGEVVAIGRLRVCKGCLLAGSGLLSGLLAGLAPPVGGPVLTAALLAFWAVWLLGLIRWRPPKLFARFLPAAMAGDLAVRGFRTGGLPGWGVVLAVAAGLWAAFRHYRRRGPHRDPCGACPEQAGPAVCTGYRPMARRERAFRRVIGRWLAWNGGIRSDGAQPRA